jgi:anhydro-N-acetylmuramic acid kinase
MSGTSLDGVDLTACRFSGDIQNPEWEIVAAETIPYPEAWKLKLANAPGLSGKELTRLDYEYGRYLGNLAKKFAKKHNFKPGFVASHGHTIFHQPARGYTLQIGHGGALAAESTFKVICDFRSLDLALGGQGAPLVPIGDQLLFGDYSACINLGGFSNISFENRGKRMAYDICPVNIALNHYADKIGFTYDENGDTAASGRLNQNLLNTLNSITYYEETPPKSLGREWVEKIFYPLIDKSESSIPDILNTLTEHIAFQIGISTHNIQQGKILITGGGAENTFLISKIREYVKHEIIIPDKQLVHFKEALIFALLGWLRSEGRINTLASVTGAKMDSSGGSIYQP